MVLRHTYSYQDIYQFLISSLSITGRTHKQTHRQTETDRQTDRQTDKRISDTQTPIKIRESHSVAGALDRQTDRETELP